jgi:hypothetical protein
LDFIGTNKFNNAVSAGAGNAVRNAAIQRTPGEKLALWHTRCAKGAVKEKNNQTFRWVHQRKRGDRKDSS